jgi:hypothetical protein
LSVVTTVELDQISQQKPEKKAQDRDSGGFGE